MKKLTLVSTFACLSLLNQVAFAYVPPSFYVVRTMAKKHHAAEDAQITSRLTVYKKNGEIYKTVTETLGIAGGDNSYVRISDENGNELHYFSRKLIGGKSGDHRRPVPYDLLFISDGANIFEHFQALGLPLKTETELYSEKEGALPYKPEENIGFERYENKVAIVLGHNQGGAKVFVDKDNFLPVMAHFPTLGGSGFSSENLQFKFSGYQMYKNFMYPKTMQVFRGNQLWAKVETIDVKIGTKPHFETPKGKHSPDSDLKDFLELYSQWVR